MAENVLVLEPGDERAQKIAKAIGSPTAGEILQLLAEKPQSLSDITDRLSLPMNTAKYHVENLLDAGVVTVADTKYSVKGRTVKIYTLTDQLLIVAPRRSDIRSILTRYAALFGIVAAASLGITAILPLLAQSAGSGDMALMATAPQAPVPTWDQATGNAGREAVAYSMKTTAESFGGAMAPAPVDPALAFFCGGILVIAILLCYEAWLWKRDRR